MNVMHAESFPQWLMEPPAALSNPVGQAYWRASWMIALSGIARATIRQAQQGGLSPTDAVSDRVIYGLVRLDQGLARMATSMEGRPVPPFGPGGMGNLAKVFGRAISLLHHAAAELERWLPHLAREPGAEAAELRGAFEGQLKQLHSERAWFFRHLADAADQAGRPN